MERGENGVLKWVHTKHLYRDFSTVLLMFKVWGLVALICFLLFGGIGACAFRWKTYWQDLWSIMFPGCCVIAGLAVATVPIYYFFAWAQGGVDEWEYEMDSCGINGRKIAHNLGRLKFLRAIAWILALFPMKPGQRMALNNFLYDRGKKKLHVDLVMLRSVTCDEKKNKIAIETVYGSEDIYVPREDYAEVRAFIEERLPKKKPKRQRTGNRKKVSTTDSKEKEVKP